MWDHGRGYEFSLREQIGWWHGKESSQGTEKDCNEKKEVGIKQNQYREGKRDATNGPTRKKNLAVTLSDISDS